MEEERLEEREERGQNLQFCLPHWGSQM